ncbi:anion exchange protein 4 isoform X4 [Meriones unguiculatus]|uniref:anion exchange protein 4 isoform X4 n=1 Tax=Meriones unguiculatus TaxID=10047 RepID=UPI000B4E9C39|nr:anion exchange protein 4 isoform X4 [Meriones unguiculatus]
MKLPGQEDFEHSGAHENVLAEELDSGLGPGPSLDGPSDTDNGELGASKDPVLFIQLNELLGWPQALEWRETGRWLLFEEKLEVGAGRWSAPHVPTLALPNLQELRRLLAEGIVLLDCQAQSLLELVEQVVGEESLSPELRGQLQALLLQRPQHHIETTGIRPCKGSKAFRTASRDEDALLKHQNPLRQKLPPGAEAAAVLAGELGFLTQPLGAFLRLRNPVVLEPLTEVILPSRFFCLLLGPPTPGRSYHEMGRAAAVLLSDQQFQWSARRASNLHDLLAALDAFLQEVTALPPGRWDRTARIPPPKSLPSQHKSLRTPSAPVAVASRGRGINYPRSKSQVDWRCQPVWGSHSAQAPVRTAGGHRALPSKCSLGRGQAPPWAPRTQPRIAKDRQCFPAVLYIYLATVTNAITFGGLLGDATEGAQGVLESFLGTAVAGAAFCLMAGQPLTILSSTGPVLVFERLLFSFSRDYNLDYLPFRLWVGIWVATFCLVLVATEASLLVRYFTRFTEEGFCALISLIFIYDAMGKMLNLIHAYPIQRPGSPAYGCFCQYPGPGGNASEWMSTRLEDTDHALSLHLGLVNASLLPPSECFQQGGYPRGPGCHTVPDIAFFSLLLFFASFLCAIALKHVKNSRLFPSVVRKVIGDFSSVLAILLGCGLDAFLGLATPKLLVPTEFKPTLPGRGWLVSPSGANPWWLSVAAAVPALLLSILIFMDQQITAVILNRAEYRLQKGAGFHLDLFCVAVLMLFTSALGLPWEQRLTGLAVFILTGVSVFLAPVLKFIPMPVLYGIFLYMGVAALGSIQFVKRVQLLLMPKKHQPDLLLLRHVPLGRVHLFTAIQLACLGLLWIIKSTPAAIIFPLMLLGLVGVRKVLEWVFSPQELLWLDELMPEEEKNISENRTEPERLFGGNDSEDSELMYQPKAPEINISVN